MHEAAHQAALITVKRDTAMHNRAARVAPKEGMWEAYFADAPRERCHGATPQEALASLRQYAAEREKASFALRKEYVIAQRHSNVRLFVLAFIALLVAAALIVQGTSNVSVPHAKMYAHHRMQGDSE
jgi:hypothetical protein